MGRISDSSETAVRMGCVVLNLPKMVEKLKGQGLPGEQHEMIVLKPLETRTLFDKAVTQKNKLIFTTAVLTGAREEELLRLQWGMSNG